MTLVETNCIFCGKESFRVDWEENGFTGKRCECGLLYVSPRPDANEILNRYNSDQANASARSRIQSEVLGRLNAYHRLRILERYRSDGALLEIGPGNGYFLDESRRIGFEPFGVELNHEQARFIRESLDVPVEATSFSISSFSGMMFDVICHFDVISHFYDPIFEFRQFHERLKENGILLFETGNGGDLSNGWLKFIGHLQYPEHLFLFSRENIETLCQRTGFEILKVSRYSILFHLVVIKMLMWVKNHVPKGAGRIGPSSNAQDFLGKSGSDSRRGVRLLKIVIWTTLFIRYRIGRWLPKIGPQTMVYVAKRRAL